MSSIKSYSPLRYPGGKIKIYDYICDILAANNSNNSTYIELFAGGAGLAMALLLNGKVKKIIINDLDYCIYCFWSVVVNSTEELCDKIQITPITMEEYAIQKNIYQNYTEHSMLDIAFATLFLNRTNRSGILKAGVIGGKSQLGDYKLDCRFNKTDIIQKIRNISKYKSQILVMNLDAVDFLNSQKDILRKKSFFYLDPPYVKKGGELYKNAFKIDDHLKLAKTVRSVLKGRKWIVSYDDNDLIWNIYRKNRIQSFNISYTAQNKTVGQELMIFSNNVKIPHLNIID